MGYARPRQASVPCYAGELPQGEPTDTMRHDCPHCGESLKHKLVRSTRPAGERRLLPLRGIACCPQCKGLLARNDHWTDKWLVLFPLPFYTVFLARTQLESRTLWLALACTALLAMGAGAVLYWRHVRTWPLYRKYEAGPQPGAATASALKPRP